jgi:hypothetical protein
MTELEALRDEIAALRKEVASLRAAIYPTPQPYVLLTLPAVPWQPPAYPPGWPYVTCGGVAVSAVDPDINIYN